MLCLNLHYRSISRRLIASRAPARWPLARCVVRSRAQCSQKRADKLRKHVALGLTFLEYISKALEAERAALLAEDPAPPKTRMSI